MSALLFELSAAPGVADALSSRLGCGRGELERRQFPDGESFLRLVTPVTDEDVLLLCTLDRPDPKVLPLLFAAAAAREQGARSVGLVAPYLAYMRQDRAFAHGEAVTSQTFAHLLSSHFDWLVTLDPHLHRYRALSEIYSVPSVAASAAEAIGKWVRSEVPDPVIVGPDEESSQWADAIARTASAKATVLRKDRTGDYEVSIDEAGLAHLASGTAVIVDDIASTARTMARTVELLIRHGHESPVCIVVHPVFAGDSYRRLLEAGPAKVVSTNSVAHESNAIDISAALAEAAREMLSAVTGKSPVA